MPNHVKGQKLKIKEQKSENKNSCSDENEVAELNLGNPNYSSHSLLCIGNAIVDVYATVDNNFYKNMGITEQVQHIELEQAQRILKNLENPVFKSGGGAANVAHIAAALNVKAVFSGCAGNDASANFFENELRNSRVLPDLKNANTATGMCLILHNGTESRIAVCPAAALEYSETDLNEAAFDKASAVVIDGYFLNRQPLVNRILDYANSRKLPVAIDAGSEHIIKENACEILNYCKNSRLIFFMNADESIAFYAAVSKNRYEFKFKRENEKIAMILNEVCLMLITLTGKHYPIFVVKLGEYGAVAAAEGQIYHEETEPVKTQNTIGAGDAFCAAFMKEYLAEKSISECLAFGNKVAGEMLQQNRLRDF